MELTRVLTELSNAPAEATFSDAMSTGASSFLQPRAASATSSRQRKAARTNAASDSAADNRDKGGELPRVMTQRRRHRDRKKQQQRIDSNSSNNAAAATSGDDAPPCSVAKYDSVRSCIVDTTCVRNALTSELFAHKLQTRTHAAAAELAPAPLPRAQEVLALGAAAALAAACGRQQAAGVCDPQDARAGMNEDEQHAQVQPAILVCVSVASITNTNPCCCCVRLVVAANEIIP